MKNIYILPTDKLSRLSNCHNNKLYLDDVRYLRNYQNIYITSSEEIKIGDYYIHEDRLHKHLDKKCINVLTNKEYTQSRLINKDSVFKKVILTTDLELQKDSIQDIPDEFLEWFVKNLSCEYVTVYDGIFEDRIWKKYIIIPKEKSKQDFLMQNLIDIMKADEDLAPKQEPHDKHHKKIYEMPLELNDLDKTCTTKYNLVEAAEKYSRDTLNKGGIMSDKQINGFIAGAKWQAEKMYNKEDMEEAFIAGGNSYIEEDDAYGTEYSKYMKKWFEQFKKK